MYLSTDVPPSLYLGKGEEKEKPSHSMKDCAVFFLKLYSFREIDWTSKIFHQKEEIPVKFHLSQKTETYLRLDEIKGIHPWFEENSRFHIFQLHSEDHALNGANPKIS